MAAALLQKALSTSGTRVEVSSAGLSQTSEPVDPVAASVLLEVYGLDIRRHQPRRLTKDLLAEEGSDLVLTMTRLHIPRVVELDRSAFSRTFTMKEFGRRMPTGSDSLEEWIASAHQGRTPANMMIQNPDDDIEDPHGKGEGMIRHTAQLLADLTVGLALGPWDEVDRD